MSQFLASPKNDFQRVRDGRNSLPLYLDIDLTNARSIAAGNMLIINISGDSFYSDADTLNCGNATVHFQDTNLSAQGAPFFVSPGFIANVPFTQIMVENIAQPGKRLRIFYGVEIDFQAGVNSSIAISGAVSVTGGVSPNPIAYNGSYSNKNLMSANTAVQILAPVANPNGTILITAGMQTINGSANPSALIAKAGAAPANVIDGDVIMMTSQGVGGAYFVYGQLNQPIFIPAGKGLYFINDATDAGQAMRFALWKTL